MALIDISEPGQEKWFEAYKYDIPVLHLNGKKVFRHRVVEEKLRTVLSV